MEQSGYKNRFEIKNQRLYLRLDASMIDKLKEIRRKTGISVSEVVREAVRRLLQDVGDSGSININID